MALPTGIDPSTYRPLPELSPMQNFVTCFVLFIFSNTQYVTFMTYLFWFMLPTLFPRSWLPVVSTLTLGVIPDLSAPENAHVEAWDLFILWWCFFGSVSAWVFFYSSLKVFGVRGWQGNLSLSLFAVLSFGLTINAYWDHCSFPAIAMFTAINFVYMSTTYTRLPENNACREWAAWRRKRLAL